ncbi:MAG TPA: sigma 54-interacting transcriptional regulator [Candidatus Binatia bacterium]|nr:sigma 54-interacting transcriptional regulator [Candidatus Binatia bacterium]
MKILVVEDDATTRTLLQHVLTARGHQVSAYSDAESAWEVYQREAFPLAIIDWLLPKMDGLQLCRCMRAHPHGDRSVIMVFTARDQPEDLEAVLDAGADDYLMKPVDIRRLNVRLTIAERHVDSVLSRKLVDTQLAEIMAQLEQSRSDLLSIFNALHVGAALIDGSGCITFLSAAAQELLGTSQRACLGRHWVDAVPFEPATKAELLAMAERPRDQRSKVSASIALLDGRTRWADIEIHDDPRDPMRKIFFLYDTSEVHDLRRLLGERAHFRDIIGKSDAMGQVFQQIAQLAAVDTTVLIEGETGTGKELVARAIHCASDRKDKPFIAVNSAGLTDSLLASQLFGHRRGAFTGAIDDHKGLFEAANGGTLFLDEIGDIPPNVQMSLLRVLQEREIIRLGESKPRPIDVRVLAATHRTLAAEVERGAFRADLLYRIRIGRIQLPPLRERRIDIPLLIATFLDLCGSSTGKHVDRVSDAAMQILLAYDWPGNVREVRNAIEFAVIRCHDGVIEVEDLPPELTDESGKAPSLDLSTEGDERQRLLAALDAAKGNRSIAARLLGISRATLYRRITELNIGTK